MDAKDLAKVWSAPDNRRLTRKQISIRLPVHVAAKIAAIGEMYPARTKTEIIGDLLAVALQDFASGLPDPEVPPDGYDHDTGEPVRFEYQWYSDLVKKHLAALETEEPEPVIPEPDDLESQAKGPERAPRGRGATRPATEARPAEAPRGARRSRKRGGAGGRRTRH